MTEGLLDCIVTPVSSHPNQVPPTAWICADNGCFGKGYPGDDKWFAWLQTLPVERCRFATAPDVVGDAAATLAPDDPGVRFTRAFNNFHMPKFMDRESIVEADFEWLWAQLPSKPGALDAEMKQNIAFCQGTLLKRKGQNSDALTVWQQGIAFDPFSPIAQKIQEQMKKTKGHEKNK